MDESSLSMERVKMIDDMAYAPVALSSIYKDKRQASTDYSYACECHLQVSV